MNEQVKTSRFAVASFVLGLLFFFPLLPAVLAVILGIVARRQIHRSEGMYLGKGLATAGIILGAVLSVFWILLMYSDSVYRVGPNDVAVITRYGKARSIAQPGLNFKIPFTEKAHRIPFKDNFEWHSTAFKCVTADGKRVTLKTKLRYRICDPMLFFHTIGLPDERLVARKLEDIFYAGLMDEANKHPLNEFVSSVRNLSIPKTLHNNFSAKLRHFGICIHLPVEPYEVLETSLK